MSSYTSSARFASDTRSDQPGASKPPPFKTTIPWSSASEGSDEQTREGVPRAHGTRAPSGPPCSPSPRGSRRAPGATPAAPTTPPRRGSERQDLLAPLPVRSARARRDGVSRWTSSPAPRSINRSMTLPPAHDVAVTRRSLPGTTLLGVLERYNAGFRKRPRQTDRGLAGTKANRRCPSHGSPMVADFHDAWVGRTPMRTHL